MGRCCMLCRAVQTALRVAGVICLSNKCGNRLTTCLPQTRSLSLMEVVSAYHLHVLDRHLRHEILKLALKAFAERHSGLSGLVDGPGQLGRFSEASLRSLLMPR